MKNVLVTAVLVGICIPQFALGMWETVLVAREGGGGMVFNQKGNSHTECLPACAADLPPLAPLDEYELCSPVRHRTLVAAYIGVSIVYGARELS